MARFGVVVDRWIEAGPATFCRTMTDDVDGVLRAYVCEMGFEHHVAVSLSQTANAIAEALSKYLAWDLYLHA